MQRRLGEAAARQTLVRVVRGLRRAERLEGFVLGVGDTWVLLARLDPNFIELDGYVSVRLVDITKVEERGGPDTFVGRALAARGQWPPTPVEVDLDDTAELFRTSAELSPLVNLYIEAEDPDMCFVGKPVRYTKRKVHFLEVTPEAEWRDDGPSKWSLDEVTRLEFSSHYIDALALIAPAAPE
ncbi:hypothetical protein CSO01_02190 [Cellulomonas soli]|uniref:Uncharacterized protein n=1 Tax=Cellulomonas soli TaxID=931535 RepID=A0A512P8I0_9CELL|nr:hypothetical protein CSO01_02190 [Cellulomonas soli]